MGFENSTGTLLEHCSNLISQTVFSSLFALLKLLNSAFASHVNTEDGKSVFDGGILAARRISVRRGDVASRVATRVPALFRQLGAGAPWTPSKSDPLVLKIQYRMNVSHSYDCMWKWQEAVQGKEIQTAHGDIPVILSEAVTDFGLAPPPPRIYQVQSPSSDHSFAEVDVGSLEMFDPMNWMSDDFCDVSQCPCTFGH